MIRTRLVIVLAAAAFVTGCSAPSPGPTQAQASTQIDPALQELLKDVPREVLTDPLLVAAAAGDAAKLKALLDAGQEFVINKDFLIAAIAGDQQCNPEVLGVLIDAGADPENGGADGTTALLAAAWAPSERCYDFLIDRGAAPARVDITSEGVLANAYLSGDAAFFERLLANADGEARNREDAAAALRSALAKRDWKACRTLLAAGADPRLPIAHGGKRVAVADTEYGERLPQCEAGDVATAPAAGPESIGENP